MDRLSLGLPGPGYGAPVQVLPFHQRTIASNESPQLTMQADWIAHDTSVPWNVRFTSGRGVPNVHFVPFQISIRPRVRPLTGSDTPAATQNFGDVQDTAVSAVSLLPAGIAALAIGVQPLPFQVE